MLVRLTRHFPVANLVSFRLLPSALLTTLLSIPLLVSAQTPTAEQIQIFQNLPADQRDVLAAGRWSCRRTDLRDGRP
jgi:hypothetical protein